MKTYTTKSGDMWDTIAYDVYGSVDHTDKLMRANTEHVDTYIFSAGIVLNVPELTNDDITASELAPWRT